MEQLNPSEMENHWHRQPSEPPDEPGDPVYKNKKRNIIKVVAQNWQQRWNRADDIKSNVHHDHHDHLWSSYWSRHHDHEEPRHAHVDRRLRDLRGRLDVPPHHRDENPWSESQFPVLVFDVQHVGGSRIPEKLRIIANYYFFFF